MAKKDTYLRTWLHDTWEIGIHEFRSIFKDGGVMLIFFVAGLVYPLLYNVIYQNGILEDTPIAVVDNAACSESRRYIREMDATREVRVAYRCMDMAEAERLMQERKINGIVLFPGDFGEKLAHMETATLSVYCDMSSFLYYKNALMAVNHVMLHEIGQIQIERYAAAGFTDIEAAQLVQAVPYEENNPYNNAFSYSFFLLSAILFVIIQQTLFYGMSLLAGTMREQNRSFASLPDPVLGGCTIMMFGSIMVSGIQMMSRVEMTQRNATIAALSFSIGIGTTTATENAIWHIFPQVVQDVFSGNCVAVVYVVAILLDTFLPANMEAAKVTEEEENAEPATDIA